MKTNSEELFARFDKAMRDGEIAYQANRDAVKAFDIFMDDDEGKAEVLVMLEGIDILISDIESIERGFDAVARATKSALR